MHRALVSNNAFRGVAQRRLFSDVRVGVLKDLGGEQRVAMVPTVAQKLIKDGYAVEVEAGAGAIAGFADSQYKDVGCTINTRNDVIKNNEMLFSVNPPPLNELDSMKGKTAVSWIGRRLPDAKDLLTKAASSGVQLVDLTAVPRITIAQKLDVLSSQAKCAGHRAVMEAAHVYGRFFAPEVTAAGKYPPTNTMILGVGVAGLAAIGTSKALGSVVRAWDVRDVSDQVQSMGASWITVDFEESGAGEGGYAKESSAEFQKAQKATFAKHLKECEIVITTAAIPGRTSPVLIEEYMVKDMKPGSVIVDLAAVGGGNCTLTRKDESYTTENGVTIIGYTDLAGRMAAQSSAMFAQNLANLLGHVSPKEKAKGFFPSIDSALAAGEEGDIVVRSIVCTKDGKEVEMPPPPQPTPPKPKAAPVEKAAPKEVSPFRKDLTNAALVTGGNALLLGMGTAVPGHLLGTFTLAGAAGYQVVWGVKHALHTPLMSVTNAISGATAFGGMMLLGQSSGMAYGLAALATTASAVNIAGGFIVTQRMLDLFKRPGDQDYSALYAIPALALVAAPITGMATVDSTGVVSQLLCIGAIGGLSSMSTAQMGCKLGMAGMAGGLTTTLMGMPSDAYMATAGFLGSGAAMGTALGMKVEPIALPQTVAAFHSLVGLAAMVTSIASYKAHPVPGCSMHNVAALLGDFIGGVTLSGSLVAFAKLNGNLGSAALSLPGKNMINAASLAAQIGLGASFLTGGGELPLWATVALSNAMGYHLVASVGGADMPVCITVLNSYSGWALVAEGFLLDSPLVTVIGSLIGFSGAILTKIMCDAMNRDIMNVIFGGMNVAAKKAGSTEVKEHTETNSDGAASILAESKSVMIVPGYGMAVARCQNSVAAIAKTLRDKGVEVRFGIHPVAGRMPGQMNVLLAEAGVPYDWVQEMDEVNPDMDNVDTCLIVGANDTTNSGAQEGDADHPLAGMPVIEVWRAKKVIFMKRTMGAGYADVENPVFFKENTDMLLGNATDTTEQIAAKVKELLG
uniref:proton-translocating NAD(P)(+) transhydrogenase n=1 Tax=Alexandrium catenella TaxID=2925 RepID=A0A7S1RP15_ALECA